MRPSARWRLAVRYADRRHPWAGGAFFAALFALLTRLGPEDLGALTELAAATGLPVAIVAAAGGFVFGAVVTPLVELAAGYWRAPLRLLEELEERVASLEEARAVQPAARVRFDYNARTHEVRLHVTNVGGPAEFCAPITIQGALTAPLESGVFAKWEHNDRPWARIAKSQTRSIRLAQLDLANVPFAQWRLFLTAEGGDAFEIRSMHASVVGGCAEKQAPPMTLEVSVVSTPDSVRPVRPFAITLHPFSAEKLP